MLYTASNATWGGWSPRGCCRLRQGTRCRPRYASSAPRWRRTTGEAGRDGTAALALQHCDIGLQHWPWAIHSAVHGSAFRCTRAGEPTLVATLLCCSLPQPADRLVCDPRLPAGGSHRRGLGGLQRGGQSGRGAGGHVLAPARAGALLWSGGRWQCSSTRLAWRRAHGARLASAAPVGGRPV